MKIIRYPEKYIFHNSNLILGSFDGIHNGHLELIKAAQKQKGLVGMMVIKNPLDIPNASDKFFEQLPVKLQKIANLGIDFVIEIDFTQDFKLLEGEVFIKTLVEFYGIKRFVAGRDFRFGIGGKSTPFTIEEDYECEIIDIKRISNIKISTTIMKEQIEFGDMEFINTLMPFPWTVQTTLKAENNFSWEKNQIKPHSGIYATSTVVGETLHPSLVHVSMDKKFKHYFLEKKMKLENIVVNIRWNEAERIIINKTLDKLTEEDVENVKKYWKNNI